MQTPLQYSASTAAPSPWTAASTSAGSSPPSSVQGPSSPPGLGSDEPPKKFRWGDSPTSENSWWNYQVPPQWDREGKSTISGHSGDGDDDYEEAFRPGDFNRLAISDQPCDVLTIGPTVPLDYVAPWEEVDGEEMLWTQGDIKETQGSLWADPEPPKENTQEKLCPVHGNICKKGICEAYSQMLRDAKREKFKAERERQGDRGKGKRRKGGKGKGKEKEGE
jgi:hypothetical protein